VWGGSLFPESSVTGPVLHSLSSPSLHALDGAGGHEVVLEMVFVGSVMKHGYALAVLQDVGGTRV